MHMKEVICWTKMECALHLVNPVTSLEHTLPIIMD